MGIMNNNCYIVLSCIVDKKRDLGLCEGKGIPKKLIIEKSNLSSSTVSRALKLLLKHKYIEEGIKQINKKTYYITELGFERMREIRKNII